MIISFRVQNHSKSRIPFGFVCVNRRHGASKVGVLNEDAIDPGNIVLRKTTEKEYDPGEVVVIQFQWPIEKVSPFKCEWHAEVGLARKWWIQEAKVDDEQLVTMPGYL
jgi:hypothetical protein